MWQLRFDPRQINELANQYEDDDEQVLIIRDHVRSARMFTKDEFLMVCRWKTPRSHSRCATNENEDIEQATKFALSSTTERLRIGVLRCLNGVDWPTASVLLHFGHHDPYPVLDVRALWSLGVTPPSSYSFEFWWQYVQICRSIAEKQRVDMRTLDRALWQYSKLHQPRLK